MIVKLSASKVISADDCRRAYWYKYIRRVSTEATSANLVFGTAVDVASRNFFDALASGTAPSAPEQDFLDLWDTARGEMQIQYPATKTPAQYREIGKAMMRALPDAWAKTRWTVATDKEGAPLTDRFLKARLGTHNGAEVIYQGVLDVAVYTAEAEFAVVDVKTSAMLHSPLYTERSDQLTGYQLLTEENAEDLGVPPVAKLGFLDLLKRKAPQIEPVMVGRRSDEQIQAYKRKLFWLADDVRHKRFPRVSRHAYNSPCDLCDFARHCVYGETDGLSFSPANGASAGHGGIT